MTTDAAGTLSEYITMAEAAKLFPGKKPCITSMFRWSSTGKRGVILRSAEFGGRVYTKREWLEQFGIELGRSRIGGRAAHRETARYERVSETR